MEHFSSHKDSFPSEGLPLSASVDHHDGVGRRGKLKIFFGMASGVGKTYAMLRTAGKDCSRGVDVVVGCIDPYTHYETAALLNGLEVISPKNTEEGQDLDLDAIIARHPYIVVVDELAHSNAPGSRHAKRYQDVGELLDNGINVYTTLSLRNLESKSDIVARITGITVTETVPDEMLEITDELELIDITPGVFLDRVAQGKVRIPPHIKESVKDFLFKKGNVIALRAMALRLVADRVDKQFHAYVQCNRIADPVKSGAHMLVLVDENPSSENVLRRAKALSYTLGADMVVLYTETMRSLDEDQRTQLARNVELARELGARILITSGKDMIASALEIAGKENITHIIIGKPYRRNFLSRFDFHHNIVGRLSGGSEGVDIYVVHPEQKAVRRKRRFTLDPDSAPPYRQYAIVVASMILAVLVCLPLAWATNYHVSFVMFFAVLVLSWAFRLKTGPVALAAALGAFLWGVFFAPPFNTLKGLDLHDVAVFLVFFAIAFVTGLLTSRVRQNERLTKKREEKTDALFRLTDRLTPVDTFEGIIMVAKEEIHRNFGMDIYFLIQDGMGVLTRRQMDPEPDGFDDSEFAIAKWAFRHSSKAGKDTQTSPGGKFTFFPLPGLNLNPGVVAVRPRRKIDSETEIFLKRFLLQISGAMEHLYYNLRAKNADLLFESDKLYRSLFNSVSHEFRIPVAAVMGAADTLLSDNHSEEIRQELLETILTASTRLNRLIDNLLNSSRLENNKVAAHLNWVDVNDLFNRVVDSLKDELGPFRTEIAVPASMPLVMIDFGLIEQALYNLVDNSCKYAPAGTTIELKAFYDNGYLVIQENDRGPGFSEDALPVAFNRFYRADNRAAGGLGLGLSIVKGFVEAHGGTIDLRNRRLGGAEFTIKIPTDIMH